MASALAATHPAAPSSKMQGRVSEANSSFVPEICMDYVSKAVFRGQTKLKPKSRFTAGVCLLVDISGFTRLSGSYCSMGKSGIDELQLATNGYMGKLVEVIYFFGGDIIKFAGDAIICYFSARMVPHLTKSDSGLRLRRSLKSPAVHEALSNMPTVGKDADTVPELHTNSGNMSPFSMTGESQKAHDEGNGAVTVEPEVVLRAMHCAHVLKDIKTEKLTVHVGISCGEICFGILGGFENRWECLISGECMNELSQCLDEASSREVVITAGCFAVLQLYEDELCQDGKSNADGDASPTESALRINTGLQYDYEVKALPSGNRKVLNIVHTGQGAKLSSSSNSNSKKSLSAPSPAGMSSRLAAASMSPSPHLRKQQSVLAIERTQDRDEKQELLIIGFVTQFTPSPILEGMVAGDGLEHIAEIREVTTMFMKWDSYDAAGKHRDLIKLQNCFYEAQKILHSTGAFLRQFLVDDKGCVLIACWGVPHMSYLDNCYRAVTCASQTRSKLLELEMACSFGITTGDVYCGTVGSELRMEYAAIGSVVNMAARLMGKAKGGIMVDDETFIRLPEVARGALTSIDPIKVKGRDEPLQVYTFNVLGDMKIQKKAVEDHEVRVICKTTFLHLLDTMITERSKPVRRNSLGTGTFSKLVSAFVGTTSASSATAAAIPTSAAAAAAAGKKEPLTPGGLNIVLMEGREGCGKTTIVRWLKKQAADRHIFVAASRLEKGDVVTEYSLCLKLFSALMPKDMFSNEMAKRRSVRELLHEIYGDDDDTIKRVALPVLHAVFNISLEADESNLSRKTYDINSVSDRKNEMTGVSNKGIFSSLSPTSPISKTRQKAAATHGSRNKRTVPNYLVVETLRKIFEHLLKERIVLVIIENVHYTDPESLKVLLEFTFFEKTRSALAFTAVSNDIKSVTPKVAPVTKTAVSGGGSAYKVEHRDTSEWTVRYRDLVIQYIGTQVITLDDFTAEEIEAMLAVALKVKKVPHDLLVLVHDFSGGSFFWVREMLHFLQEHGPDAFMQAIGGPTSEDLGLEEREGPHATRTSTHSSQSGHRHERTKHHDGGGGGGGGGGSDDYDGNSDAAGLDARPKPKRHISRMYTPTSDTRHSMLIGKQSSSKSIHPSVHNLSGAVSPQVTQSSMLVASQQSSFATTTTTTARRKSFSRITSFSSFIFPVARVGPEETGPADMREAAAAAAAVAVTVRSASAPSPGGGGGTQKSAYKLEHLVIGRFEKCSTDVQIVLRAASIIGFTFSHNVLYGVLPERLKEEMSNCLHVLQEQKWIYEDHMDNMLFQFAHRYTHKVIYELTPANERRLMHENIAKYLEHTCVDDPSQFTLLSFHCKHFDTDKALKYAVQAISYILDKDTLYELNECIDLLFGSMEACRTRYDVEVVEHLVKDVKKRAEVYAEISNKRARPLDMQNRPVDGQRHSAASKSPSFDAHDSHTGGSDNAGGGGSGLFFSCTGSRSVEVLAQDATSKGEEAASGRSQGSGGERSGGERRGGSHHSRISNYANKQAQQSHAVKTANSFLESLEDLSSLLECKMAELNSQGEVAEPSDWQRKYLGISSKEAHNSSSGELMKNLYKSTHTLFKNSSLGLSHGGAGLREWIQGASSEGGSSHNDNNSSNVVASPPVTMMIGADDDQGAADAVESGATTTGLPVAGSKENREKLMDVNRQQQGVEVVGADSINGEVQNIV